MFLPNGVNTENCTAEVVGVIKEHFIITRKSEPTFLIRYRVGNTYYSIREEFLPSNRAIKLLHWKVSKLHLWIIKNLDFERHVKILYNPFNPTEAYLKCFL